MNARAFAPFATANMREWLAGAAMSGILASGETYLDKDGATDYVAKLSVEYADALLARLLPRPNEVRNDN